MGTMTISDTTREERLFIRAAIIYAQANLEDVAEAFEWADAPEGENLVRVEGSIFALLTYDDITNLKLKLPLG